MQTFLTPEKLWPGGIPSSVRPHPNGDLTNDEMKEESKGWCQFVEEEYVPKTDLGEERQQRRALIERWASADQAFRDSYQNRAPLRNSPLDYPSHLLSNNTDTRYVKRFFCLAPVDKEHHADNYKRLVKLLILLYYHDNRGSSHPRATETWESPQLPYILADSTAIDVTNSFSSGNLLLNIYLQPANFHIVSMTCSGTVIFPFIWARQEYMVINQDSLCDGRPAFMTFKSNGEIADHAVLLPWTISYIMTMRLGKGWGFGEMLDPEEHDCGDPSINRPLNMDKPLLTIVESAFRRKDLRTARSRPDLWGREIERFAPGYLALETRGREIDYDLANLWTEDIDSYSQYPSLLEDFIRRIRQE